MRCLPGVATERLRWYYHFMSSVVQCQTEAEEEIVIRGLVLVDGLLETR